LQQKRYIHAYNLSTYKAILHHDRAIEVAEGHRQGDPLSSGLFALGINELIEVTNEDLLNRGICSAYADTTITLYKNIEMAQLAREQYERQKSLLAEIGLEFNVEKTVVYRWNPEATEEI